ncbi:MAG TPA: hypothetical protein VFE24_01960 [Pirellulales bacterium]|jgi:hypothetical protein|nr:hypothetical protein [Pirellulales bacterium]
MSTELERLQRGPAQTESPGGIGTVRFIARCPDGNAGEVLAVAKSALEVAIRLSQSGVFEENAWMAALPDRFVKNSALHPSQEEIDREAALPLEERIRLSRETRCSVRGFMNSFLPELELKGWSWWDAAILDENHIAVAVEVEGWPFPWGSLRWLFRTSGAADLESEP